MMNAIKFLAAITGVALLGLGFMTMFLPGVMYSFFEIMPTAVYGTNTIRADIGGLLMACGLMIWIGLQTNQKLWFTAALLLISLVFLGRLVSMVMDGWTSAAIPAMGMEVFAMVVLFFTHKDRASQ